MLDRRWDVPTSEYGVGPTSWAALATVSGRTPVGVAPRQPAAAVAPAMAVQQVAAPVARQPATSTLGTSTPGSSTPGSSTPGTSPLPRVEFPEVAVHGGGWGVSQVSGLSGAGQTSQLDYPGETPTALDDAEPGAPGGAASRARGSDGAEPNSRAASSSKDAALAVGVSLGQTVRELVANTSGLPKPAAMDTERDPFEADFGGGSLPSLGAASLPGGPVPLKRQGSPEQPPAADGASSPGSRAVAAGRSTTSWNGGCQRAFDASVQNVGPGPTAKDATSADYTRVLSRLNVGACNPRGTMSIDVCVAVQDGRAAGITVHTTPAASSMGECVSRRVRALSFPSSGGVDLVRTQFHVD
jgi:hypothetical protein